MADVTVTYWREGTKYTETTSRREALYKHLVNLDEDAVNQCLPSGYRYTRYGDMGVDQPCSEIQRAIKPEPKSFSDWKKVWSIDVPRPERRLVEPDGADDQLIDWRSGRPVQILTGVRAIAAYLDKHLPQ